MAIKNELLALSFGALTKLGFEVWIQKGCGLNRCFTSIFWSHCQISTTKIRQYFVFFWWWKSYSTSPQVCHSTQNTILTKLSLWEYGNKGAPFSLRKFSKVSGLVRYGAPAKLRACVYGARQCVRTRTRQSIKHVDTYHIHGETNVT